ncbi:MAG: DNA polymerase III subunit beta [Erysipelotrichaceae bacterium]|nr:DNA polymerase III subunit beta [Erysipelotrichaceae bacterium]MBQ4252261.1 DNA polymerase III subunit beta [Erysipelotrichaceae bacterium]
MYFKISKKEFLNKLNIVSKAVSNNSPLPSLHGIKMVVNDDSIELTASDMDITIRSLITRNEENNLVINDPGELILDSRYILDMIRKIDSENVEIELIDGCAIKISGDSVHFDLNGSKTDNYPLINFDRPENSFNLNGEALKNIISQTCFAASDKENRPVLMGLNMKCDGGKLTCVATDSYRLAQKVMYLDNVGDFNVTVPSKSLMEVAKIIENDQDVRVSVNNKKIVFESEDTFIQTRLIDGTYPETSRLIPSQFSYELILDSKDLLNAIDRSSFIKNDGVSIVKMQMNESEVIVSSRSNEVSSIERIVPINYVGNNLSISFKGQYVYDAIKAVNAFQIRILFSGDMKPFIIKSTENDNIIQLVLPIRTYA